MKIKCITYLSLSKAQLHDLPCTVSASAAGRVSRESDSAIYSTGARLSGQTGSTTDNQSSEKNISKS